MDSVKAMREKVKDYIDTADEKVVKTVHAMLEADGANDWWNELPDNVKDEVEEAMQQADRGEGIPHEEIKKRYAKWFVR